MIQVDPLLVIQGIFIGATLQHLFGTWFLILLVMTFIIMWLSKNDDVF